MFLRLHETLPAPAQVEWHEQVKRIVTVAGKDEGGQTRLGNPNAQLLGELPYQAFLWGFPRINLTAWKFPQPFHLFTTWSFSDEHASIGVDERRGGDEENLGQVGSGRRIGRARPLARQG